MSGLEMVEGTKMCRRCRRRDELDEFPPNPRVSDGRSRAPSMSQRRDGRLAGGQSRQGELQHPEPAGEARAAAVVECGEQFVPGRSDALVCSKRCRWRRSRAAKERRRVR